MNLYQALQNQGYDYEEVDEIIEEMRTRIIIHNEWPDDVLYDYGLEPDYVLELLTEPQNK